MIRKSKIKKCPRCGVPSDGNIECEVCGLNFNEYKKTHAKYTGKYKSANQSNKSSSPVHIIIGVILGFIVLIILIPLIAKISESSPVGITGIIILFFAMVKNFFFTHPIVSILVCGVLLYLAQEKAKKNRLKLGMEKICPHCRETIDGGATVCKFCQRDVT